MYWLIYLSTNPKFTLKSKAVEKHIKTNESSIE